MRVREKQMEMLKREGGRQSEGDEAEAEEKEEEEKTRPTVSSSTAVWQAYKNKDKLRI